jgi:hypothetical protein
MSDRLSPEMSASQFDNGYWYADELRTFARSLGIPLTSNLRKDELESAIRHYLVHREVVRADQRIVPSSGVRDIDLGLTLDLPVRRYTSNRITKNFIAAEARKIAPDLKKKSGASYRLNRWREEQIASGHQVTYGDLVRQYIALNQLRGRFAQIPHGRYINFVSDFIAHEPGGTHRQAVRAWEEIKNMDAPKTYTAWKRLSRPS